MIKREDYPKRYYASYDKDKLHITGWYDTWDMSSVDNVPDASDLIVVTEKQWNDTTFRKPTGKGVKSGKIVDHEYKPDPVPLSEQAQTEMAWITQQASIASAMGEVFSDEMKEYVNAIREIISGTSKEEEIPERPKNIMV